MHSHRSNAPYGLTVPHYLGLTPMPTNPRLRFFATPADTGTGAPADPPADDDANKPDGDAGKTDPPAGDADKGKLDELTTEQLKGIITDLRRENAGKRTTARDATADATAAKAERDALTEAVVKALGIEVPGDEAPTIESLQVQLTEATGKATAGETAAADLQRENLVLRHAAALGANGDRLLDSNAFLKTLSAVDPSGDKAADDVSKAITDALAKDAGFALVKVPGSSGGTDHTGGDNTGRAKSMREAAAKRLGFTQ